ncbi:MAG: aminotransferase class V-fold PLP-dependent enzyme [Candidatus Melainabacteria bacterium]|nr:aminotransferase class V-fold PLP-dependent enzyme [Candidatus Melainabacteria bacterium]
MSRLKEIPPTAGMPLQWSDFFSTDSDLEGGLANYFNNQTKIRLLSSGTAALIVALSALKKLEPQKDEVIIPAFTCPLVAIACNQAGLKIRLCDFKKDSDQLDPDFLKQSINHKTLCVIPTHLGFYPQKMDEIMSIAREHNIFVVEDAAQALGAKFEDTQAGLSGDIGIFSLTAGKGLTIFEGGTIACSNQTILEKIDESINELAQYNLFSELILSLKLIAYMFLYNPTGLSIAYGAPLRAHLQKGDEIKALDEEFKMPIPVRRVGYFRRLVGASALKRFDQFLNQKQTDAQKRMSQLKELESLDVFLVSELNVSIKGCFAYVLLKSKKDLWQKRVLEKLWTSGLGVSKAFACELSAYPYLKDIVPKTTCPNAEDFAKQTISISNSHYLSDLEFIQIIESIKESSL